MVAMARAFRPRPPALSQISARTSAATATANPIQPAREWVNARVAVASNAIRLQRQRKQSFAAPEGADRAGQQQRQEKHQRARKLIGVDPLFRARAGSPAPQAAGP